MMEKLLPPPCPSFFLPHHVLEGASHSQPLQCQTRPWERWFFSTGFWFHVRFVTALLFILFPYTYTCKCYTCACYTIPVLCACYTCMCYTWVCNTHRCYACLRHTIPDPCACYTCTRYTCALSTLPFPCSFPFRAVSAQRSFPGETVASGGES